MDFVDKLIERMQSTPHEFSYDGYHLIHIKSGISIWAANGFWFYTAKPPNSYTFNYWHKFRFGFAFKKWLNDMLILKLDKGKETPDETTIS